MKLKKIRKLISVGVLALFTICGVMGCGTSEEKSDSLSSSQSLLESIKADGKLVVGTASGYAPYEFADTSEGNKIVGVDIELAQAIADELGVKLEVQDMTFSALLSSLTANKIDLAIAGICVTEERKKTIDFSDTYIDAEQKVLVRKEDVSKYTTLDKFDGDKVGAQKSTTQETLANTEIKDATVVSLEKVPDLILELKDKKINGIIIESVVAEQYILANPDLVLCDAKFENNLKPTAIALRKGNEDLVEILNKVIKENRDNGNIDKWIEEYSKKSAENAK